MLHLDPKEIPIPDLHKLLLGGIAPRPIALVSTISTEGINNLSPFSFFNCFGANPPTVVFSPTRRGRDGSFKDTYNNLLETKECVIHAVTYSMVEQVSLASTEYDSNIDEFAKSGLTPIDSEIVKPKRVKESPFQMECILREMINLGDGRSSGNLAICTIVKIHVAEDIFENGIIHPNKIDLVARMSGDFYCRAFGNNVFEIEKPLAKKGIGFDKLPDFMKNSEIYSGNNLGKFANVESIPDENSVKEFNTKMKEIILHNYEHSAEAFERYLRDKRDEHLIKFAIDYDEKDKTKKVFYLETAAKIALENNKVENAWLTALTVKYYI